MLGFNPKKTFLVPKIEFRLLLGRGGRGGGGGGGVFVVWEVVGCEDARGDVGSDIYEFSFVSLASLASR